MNVFNFLKNKSNLNKNNIININNLNIKYLNKYYPSSSEIS